MYGTVGRTTSQQSFALWWPTLFIDMKMNDKLLHKGNFTLLLIEFLCPLSITLFLLFSGGQDDEKERDLNHSVGNLP